MAENRILYPVMTDATGQEILEQYQLQTAYLAAIASESMASLKLDWESIRRIVQKGIASSIFHVGDQIAVPWSDGSTEYSIPFDVVHFGNVTKENGDEVPGMFLQMHYATLNGVQFSHPRAFLACPDGLSAGTYYFTIESSYGSNVSAGDVVCFTTTVDVPSGGRIAGCYGAPDQAKSNWRIYTYNADGKTILETLTPTFSASGTSLGTMKSNTRNGNLNSVQEMAYGYNRWKTSAFRQYANSAAAAGSWWTPADTWDICPDQLASIRGFLAGFDEDFVNILKKVKVTTYTNTVTDDGSADETYDKFFLPSLEQMYCNPQISGEGDAWDYWKERSGRTTPTPQGSTNANLITYALENHASAQSVRLRSASRGNATYAWYVTSSGGVGTNYAGGAFRGALACAIC